MLADKNASLCPLNNINRYNFWFE